MLPACLDLVPLACLVPVLPSFLLADDDLVDGFLAPDTDGTTSLATGGHDTEVATFRRDHKPEGPLDLVAYILQHMKIT